MTSFSPGQSTVSERPFAFGDMYIDAVTGIECGSIETSTRYECHMRCPHGGSAVLRLPVDNPALFGQYWFTAVAWCARTAEGFRRELGCGCGTGIRWGEHEPRWVRTG